MVFCSVATNMYSKGIITYREYNSNEFMHKHVIVTQFSASCSMLRAIASKQALPL